MRRLVPLCLAFLAACDGLDVQNAGPLMVSLTATPTSVTVGTSVNFQFAASGEQLEGIALSYGDGIVDEVATFLARTANGNRSHLYQAPGSYLARVTVIDNRYGQAEDTVTVQVSAPVPAPHR